MHRPRLRDNKNNISYELYSLGQFPNDVIYNISKWMTYYFAMGRADIDGEDWGDIFSKSINGDHLDKPIGLADVVYEGMAWSVKSIKSAKPFTQKHIRLISGRNSPKFSFGLENANEDIQKTGEMVLSIWNERVNLAKEKYDQLRTCILIRNFNSLQFTLFEYETPFYNLSDFIWKENNQGNFEGYNVDNGKHYFTWQPHGSQFTILCDVPNSAKRFQVRRPPIFDLKKTMDSIGFNNNWVRFM